MIFSKTLPVIQRSAFPLADGSRDVLMIEHYGEITPALEARLTKAARALGDLAAEAHVLLLLVGPYDHVNAATEGRDTVETLKRAGQAVGQMLMTQGAREERLRAGRADV